MRRFFEQMNPMLRGFLIIGAIALTIMVLNLYVALFTVAMLLRIAFFLAIAFFIYLLWRERRGDISVWPDRAKWVFYGAAILIVVDLAVLFWRGVPGRDALAFILVLAACVYSMFRVWRDQHTYS